MNAVGFRISHFYILQSPVVSPARAWSCTYLFFCVVFLLVSFFSSIILVLWCKDKCAGRIVGGKSWEVEEKTEKTPERTPMLAEEDSDENQCKDSLQSLNSLPSAYLTGDKKQR